jgi:hypothetical protein
LIEERRFALSEEWTYTEENTARYIEKCLVASEELEAVAWSVEPPLGKATVAEAYPLSRRELRWGGGLGQVTRKGGPR